MPNDLTLNDGPVPVTGPAVCVPGVLVIDVSWSMANALPAARAALDDFIAELRRTPQVAEVAWLSIVTFADTTEELLGFSRIADPAVQLPVLSPRGNGTNYEAGLDQAHRTLATGLPALTTTADGRRAVNRPTIYFISDGQPNTGGDWMAVRRAIKAHDWAPNIFAFGFDQADEHVIRQVADEGLAYFAAAGEVPLTVFKMILKVIFRSLITVSAAAAGGAAAAPPPDPTADPATAGLVRLDTVM